MTNQHNFEAIIAISLIGAIVLAGCTATQDVGFTSEAPEDTIAESYLDLTDRRHITAWWVCVPPYPDDIFCLVQTEQTMRPFGPYTNATIKAMEFTVDWDSENPEEILSGPSIQGREIYIACDDENGGDCLSFGDERRYSVPEPPAEITIMDLDLPPGTEIIYYSHPTDPVPDPVPVQFEFDLDYFWSIEAIIHLESVEG